MCRGSCIPHRSDRKTAKTKKHRRLHLELFSRQNDAISCTDGGANYPSQNVRMFAVPIHANYRKLLQSEKIKIDNEKYETQRRITALHSTITLNKMVLESYAPA